MMIGLIFWVKAKPGDKEAFVEFLQWDAQVAKESEPGALRFEFYDDPNDADALYVYEAYQDEDAFAAHQANEPFQKWRSEMMPKAEAFKIIMGMGPCRGSMAE